MSQLLGGFYTFSSNISELDKSLDKIEPQLTPAKFIYGSFKRILCLVSLSMYMMEKGATGPAVISCPHAHA